MRIAEFIHDKDHPQCTNVDFWIQKNIDYELEKFIVSEIDDFSSVKGFDLIILHGGSQHLWNKEADPWLYNEIKYVKYALKNKIPIIGFCLGSQIIAETLGGKVFKAEEKEVGWFKVTLRKEVKNNLLIKNLEDGLISFMWHSDHYNIPNNCTSLGFTEAASNQIFTSNNSPAVGFQFHPEYTKENIKAYLETYEDEHWSGGKYALGKEYFINQMNEIPETYNLFEQLMKNSLEWFLVKKQD
ncbi:type 1 glutamine amidotransferase [Clostridium sp. WILCCON 0269]|uniref:Type 1 glutamine amidotransferase n=1 Tax=Candidatus Clostridium eludens TaxID=3381663 RepID=A0ABW8SPM0_9CLOT